MKFIPKTLLALLGRFHAPKSTFVGMIDADQVAIAQAEREDEEAEYRSYLLRYGGDTRYTESKGKP